jgi:hypothetical protein
MIASNNGFQSWVECNGFGRQVYAYSWRSGVSEGSVDFRRSDAWKILAKSKNKFEIPLLSFFLATHSPAMTGR